MDLEEADVDGTLVGRLHRPVALDDDGLVGGVPKRPGRAAGDRRHPRKMLDLLAEGPAAGRRDFEHLAGVEP